MQYNITMLKTMEDGGMLLAGPLILTNNTILHSMAFYTLMAITIISGGSR